MELRSASKHQIEHENEAIILASFPNGELSKTNFEIIKVKDFNANDLAFGEILLQLYGISVDPYMRTRFDEQGSKEDIFSSFKLGDPIHGGAFAKVVASKNANFYVGEFVAGADLKWQRKQIVNPYMTQLEKSFHKSINLCYKLLNPFNIAPLTAWLPIREFWPLDKIPSTNVTAYVSGAAGAVGMIAGQILKKIYGFERVIGSAGTDEKVRFLREVVGYDDAFNYKRERVADALTRLAPNRINYFFDNVGGHTLDDTLANMKYGGKIIICGAVSTYNNESLAVPMTNLFYITTHGLCLQGFLLKHFHEQFDIANEDLMRWLQQGLLVTTETYVEGFENAPDALIGLFQGANIGKMMVRVINENSSSSSSSSGSPEGKRELTPTGSPPTSSNRKRRSTKKSILVSEQEELEDSQQTPA